MRVMRVNRHAPSRVTLQIRLLLAAMGLALVAYGLTVLALLG